MAQETIDAFKNHTQQSEEGGTGTKFWKLPSKFEGTKVIRILPPIKSQGEKLFFHQYKYHFLSGTSIQCAGRNKCKICKKASQLWDGNNRDGESSLTAKKLFAKDAYLSRIVVREDGEDKVEVFGFGNGIYEKIKAAILNEDFGDITDIKEGNDFKLIKTGKGRDSKYNSSVPTLKKSPIAASADQIKAILTQAKELNYSEYIDAYDDDTAVAALEEFLNGDGDADETPAPAQKSFKSEAKQEVKIEKKEIGKSSKKESGDEELDDLLKEFEEET
jgi:hypothetical protein